MSRKVKYSIEEKLNAVQKYLDGKESMYSIANRFGINVSAVRLWVNKYRAMGVDAFSINQNKLYTKEKKEQAVAAYLHGEGSLRRKTTFEERIEIASYCISHDHNYAETAEKFCVSYQQARNYTVKYEHDGIDALQDNRGKRKPEDTLTEVERLRAELKLEKAKRQKAEMEASFLKKLNEIERRRG